MKHLRDLLAEAKNAVKLYEPDEAMQRHGDADVVFVDVRGDSEVEATGKIPGAVHASRGMLEHYIDAESPKHMDVFDEDKEFIFYCLSGGRSAMAAQRAKEMGVERAASLEGGFPAWMEAGGHTESA